MILPVFCVKGRNDMFAAGLKRRLPLIEAKD
mgnify:CR=1 FL=1